MPWTRPKYTKPCDSPFLFYVIFGAKTSDLKVSKSKHRIDGMPEELEVHSFSKANPGHRDWINGFLTGHLGSFLEEKGPELFKTVKNWNEAAVVQGTFPDSPTLDYLKNTLGIVQALVETGASGVFDPQILQWYPAHQWSEVYFAPFAPQPHRQVWILKSQMDTGLWLHTRGLRKFGRPDLSIRGLDEKDETAAAGKINRLIEDLVLGMDPSSLGPIQGDHDNPDFNNYFVEIDFKNIQ